MIFEREGRLAAERFLSLNLEHEVLRAAGQSKVAPSILASVLAVEIQARGPIWRGLERVSARALLALGSAERVGRLSLGIAQIQPRRIRRSESIQEKVGRLSRSRDSMELCAEIVAAICADAALAPRAASWTHDDWAALATRYGGDPRYGISLRAAHSLLHLAPGYARQ